MPEVSAGAPSPPGAAATASLVVVLCLVDEPVDGVLSSVDDEVVPCDVLPDEGVLVEGPVVGEVLVEELLGGECWDAGLLVVDGRFVVVLVVDGLVAVGLVAAEFVVEGLVVAPLDGAGVAVAAAVLVGVGVAVGCPACCCAFHVSYELIRDHSVQCAVSRSSPSLL